MNTGWVLILLTSFVAASFLTWMVRRHAISTRLMDVPTERSSHAVPTPRGGGLAIVAVVLLVLPWLWLHDGIATSALIGWFGAGAAVATVGWLDDRQHLPARWRLLVHFVAAGWAIFWLGGLPPITLLGWDVHFGWLGYPVAAFYLVWLLNLYNFMDGIDGIAGIEAITVGLGAALVSWLAFPDSSAWMAPVAVAAAAAGFLVWNFPLPRIFMGDSGSGFLGVTFGILSVQAGWLAPELFWAWIILLGVFFVDATVTLLRRLLRGERVYEAHRIHAYQHAARRLDSHVPVSLAIGTINLLWLLPVAVVVTVGASDGSTAVLVAYAPLVVLAFWMGAGSAD